MEDKKKSYYLIVVMPILYALMAFGVAKLIESSGIYPSGADTLCHLYKGDALYQAVGRGDYWPAYDPLWYNGTEMLRYWAPLPSYILAVCQFFGNGSPMGAYLVFVMAVCFVGAFVWFYIGFKVRRPYFGAFIGALWFFMPSNLYALLREGNLPRSICITILPLLMYWIYDYFSHHQWRTFPKISVCFAFLTLCSPGYAGMIAVSLTVYFAVDALIFRQWFRGLRVLVSVGLGALLAGAWLIPYLSGNLGANDSEVMADYFQNLFLTINPAARLQNGCVDYYFGLAALLLAVFGILLSKKKSMPGFWTGLILLLCSSETMYLVLSKLPGGDGLWMLRFLSIGGCMILFSFLIWDTLKKGWIVLFALLLTLDALPSLPLAVGEQNNRTPGQAMESCAEWTLIDEAKKITKQRLAVVDKGVLDSMSTFLVTGYGEPKASAYGASWQPSATVENCRQLDRALEEGNYLYLFDRCLEMGNDTVLIRLDIVSNMTQSPVEKMDEAASRSGYVLADYNEGYRLYKVKADGNWGTVTKYRAIGIGSAAPSICRQFPVMEETETTNLNEFSFEDLCEYELIYLSGFTYDDKAAAEDLITKLSEAGVHIVIAADGIPDDRGSQNQSFLGAVCNGVSFSQGYPDLDTIDGVLETDLFPNGYRDWSTVYLDGLDEVWGTVSDVDWNLPFYGTVKNDNIVMIGLNLTYYYGLTRDEGVGKLLSRAMDISSNDLPEREIVPYEIQYTADHITIDMGRDDVNTSLAYHDSFTSNQEIYSRNHQLFVKSGVTVISFTYPYLKQGIAVSIGAALLIIAYSWHMRRRLGKSKEEME